MKTKNIVSKATNEETLTADIIRISRENPNQYVTYWRVFGSATITVHEKHPKTYEGEDCYQFYGDFFKNGKIVKPNKSWLKQYHNVTCRD